MKVSVLTCNKLLWCLFHSYCAPGFVFIEDVIVLILYCFNLPVTLFLGWDCQTLPESLWGLFSWVFFLVRAATPGPKNLWSSSPIEKSTIETTLMESPSMLNVSGAWQKWDGTSKVYLHYTSHENGVQAWYQVEANAQTNLCIQDGGWADICQ